MEVKGIVTIGLEHIHPHPDNPRKDLGDLTELAEYSSYEHERKEFDPEIYRKCEKYLKEKEGGGRC